MTRNQKILIGVGVIGTAGYLIYKQNQKPAVAASFAGKRNLAGMGGLTFTGAPCAKSPENGLVSSLPVDLKGFGAGTTIYECCKPGVFGTARGSTGCTNPKMTTISTLEPVNFAGAYGGGVSGGNYGGGQPRGGDGGAYGGSGGYGAVPRGSEIPKPRGSEIPKPRGSEIPKSEGGYGGGSGGGYGGGFIKSISKSSTRSMPISKSSMRSMPISNAKNKSFLEKLFGF